MNFPLLSSDKSAEFELRIQKVRQIMSDNGLDAVLINSSVNLFYLTGGVCRGYFYLTSAHSPLLFIIPPGSSENAVYRQIRKPENIPSILEAEGYPTPKRVGLEFSDLYYSDVERLKKIFPESEIADATKVMRKARETKTPYELEMMKEDGIRQSSVYSRISSIYREEMTDVEFQTEIERILRLEGCLGYLRAAGARMELNLGSVIAGENADEPSPYDFSMGGGGVDPSLPVGANGMIMKRGETVMVDMNGCFNGYQTDMTRCYAIGNTSELAKKAHECSREILRDLETFGRPGVEIGEMYRRAVKKAEDAGLSDYFMGHKHKVAFIGHGVGIELNEGPVIMERNRSMLEENMTLAIEPKFVIPGVGAVGVENTYIVRADGLENLTQGDENLNEL